MGCPRKDSESDHSSVESAPIVDGLFVVLAPALELETVTMQVLAGTLSSYVVLMLPALAGVPYRSFGDSGHGGA